MLSCLEGTESQSFAYAQGLIFSVVYTAPKEFENFIKGCLSCFHEKCPADILLEQKISKTFFETLGLLGADLSGSFSEPIGTDSRSRTLGSKLDFLNETLVDAITESGYLQCLC